MNTMKILLVEDNRQQQDAFENSVEVLKDRDNITVEHKITEDISDAVKEIEDGSYDGAIIDLRLGNDEEGGNKVVSQLRDPFTRIPIIFRHKPSLIQSETTHRLSGSVFVRTEHTNLILCCFRRYIIQDLLVL